MSETYCTFTLMGMQYRIGGSDYCLLDFKEGFWVDEDKQTPSVLGGDNYWIPPCAINHVEVINSPRVELSRQSLEFFKHGDDTLWYLSAAVGKMVRIKCRKGGHWFSALVSRDHVKEIKYEKR